ncbi:HTH cro/C1-type domain-containing protein [Pseudomonas marincola]|uniref:HTH cro/C1-type domain-containing protein n=1 Tax=Pseudomonas marincola TaxID=437900 RepID=A0A653E975_9PSED|nr:helix-turn-helix transcriptional regulator [Pseudomonas marincola]CAE6923617.1 HTH cro/C1-type domain-containing protein [Pseudomonas marincola]
MHLSKEAIGNRLQEERKRLGFNQDVFAQQVGVAKRTLAGYEGGSGDIGALVLAHAATLGLDVLYVVTGQRTPEAASSFTVDEADLVANYRKLPDSDRVHTHKMITALSEMAGRYEAKP